MVSGTRSSAIFDSDNDVALKQAIHTVFPNSQSLHTSFAEECWRSFTWQDRCQKNHVWLSITNSTGFVHDHRSDFPLIFQRQNPSTPDLEWFLYQWFDTFTVHRNTHSITRSLPAKSDKLRYVGPIFDVVWMKWTGNDHPHKEQSRD